MKLTIEEFNELLAYTQLHGPLERAELDQYGFGVTRIYHPHRFEGDDVGLCVRTSPFNTVEVFKLHFAPARAGFIDVIPEHWYVARVINSVVTDDSDMDNDVDSSGEEVLRGKCVRRRTGK